MASPRRLLLATTLGLLIVGEPAYGYNSEEHKILVDWGASMTRPHPSIALPAPTAYQVTAVTTRQQVFKNAKLFAVGFDTNVIADYSEDVKKVQDHSYWYDYGWKQILGNKQLYIPPVSLVRDTALFVGAVTAGAQTAFTIGELSAIYGDYRRTTKCDAAGNCYLTNVELPFTTFGEGYDCFLLDCGWRPDDRTTTTYLRFIGSGLWPPYACVLATANDDQYEEAGWWGDEMVRIAKTNDWHFSSGAVAWYVGMHRLALLHVDRARTDPRAWTQALHYEANALHSLIDLFAFGHVVTNRDRTSWHIMEESGLTSHPSYQWMANVIRTGGGVRDVDGDGDATDGRIDLVQALPPIADTNTHARNEFMSPSNSGWGTYALQEKDFHDAYNHGGATVRNLKGDRFYIQGDGEMRHGASAAMRTIAAEAARASIQSLYDAHQRLAAGETVEQIGDAGDVYFEALKNLPVFVESNAYYTHQQDGECYPAGTGEPTGHNYDGRWARYALFVDYVTGAGVVPAPAGTCLVRYEDGELAIAGPVANPIPCTTFPEIPEPPGPAPSTLFLAQNRPNPAGGTTVIEYGVPVEAHVRLAIFDARGATVRVLEDAVRTAATHTVAWDGRDNDGKEVGAGVYYCRLSVEGEERTKKLVLYR